MKTKRKRNRLILVDGNNYINRAYHATPKGLKSKDGTPTNAIKGFINILVADLNKLAPTHVGVVFDRGGKPNWRCEVYPEYKANRREWKEKKDKKSLERIRQYKEMIAQGPDLRKLLKAMGFRIIRKTGVEADDLMGTLAVQYAAKGFEVIICSNDKDMAQIVSEDIKLMRPDRELLGPREIYRDFGVRPNQIIDYLCLLGDKVDNIEGVVGIGPKTAKTLLGEHGDLKTIVKKRKSLSAAIGKALATAKPALKVTPKIINLRLDEPHKVTEEALRFPNETFNLKKVGKVCERLALAQTFKHIKGCHSVWTRSSTQTSNPRRLW